MLGVCSYRLSVSQWPALRKKHLTSGEAALPGGRALLPAPLGRDGTCTLLLGTGTATASASGAAGTSAAAFSASDPSASASGRFLDARVCCRGLLPMEELVGGRVKAISRSALSLGADGPSIVAGGDAPVVLTFTAPAAVRDLCYKLPTSYCGGKALELAKSV